MQHLDEGTIHAWIDGALSSDEANSVDAHVASCAECAAKVAEARGLVAASSRIVSALDVTPGGVLPAFGARKPRPWWKVGMSVGVAMAASLVIAVAYGVMRGPSESETVTETFTMRSADTAPPKAMETPIPTPPPSPIVKMRPRQLVADRIVPAIDSSRLTVAQGVPDSNTRMEAMRRMTNINDSVRPTPAPMAASKAMGMGATINATSVGGSGGGGRAGVRAQPAASAVNAFAPTSALPARVTFVGCYEADQSTSVLPRRFALRSDSVSGNEVRYVDSTGAIGGRIADVDWVDANGRAIIRSIDRGAIMTIVRTPAFLGAQSLFGPRTLRVVPCR